MQRAWNFLRALPEAIKIILVAALVFLVTDTCSGRKAKTEIETYIEKYEEFEKQTESTVKMIDSVKQEADAKAQEAAKYMQEADSLRDANARLLQTLPSPRVVDSLRTHIDSLKVATKDSVELARTVIPAQDDLIEKLDSTNTGLVISNGLLNRENLGLRASHGKLTLEIVDLRFALDSARTNLVNIPEPPKNPDKFFFGLLNKPTRTQTAVIGFVGGVVTTAIIINNVEKNENIQGRTRSR